MTQTENGRLLKDAGFYYNFVRECFINERARKMISIEYVEYRDVRRAIASPRTGAWQLFFLRQPSPKFRRQIIASRHAT